MARQDDFFRDCCEGTPDLVQCVSLEGRFLYVNPAWLQTFGYTQEEIGLLTFLDLVHPESRDRCRQLVQEWLAGAAIERFQADFQAKDGHRVRVDATSSCPVGDDGRPTHRWDILRDVTGGARAEEQLDQLFELSLDLLCVAGTDAYFKRVNPAFQRVLGYSPEEMLSRSFLEFIHPDDRESTVGEVDHLAHGDPVVDYQNRYRAKDGAYRWIAWRAAPLASQGLIYAVGRDITDQKRNQELLTRQARELARSNADLEQFAYVASHDLRAPLRAMGHLVEWIEEDLGDSPPLSVGQHLEELKGRVARVHTLIDDLLQYARAGRSVEETSSVDTRVLVSDLVALLAPPDGFVVETAGDMPVFETTRAPLEQVLRNLIANAIKYHDRPQGRITVSATSRASHYEFAVADDGPGIPEAFHEKIFHMFQKLESPDEVEGTGMGLALVKRLVEHHGGRVTVESAGERGTTFRFTWPKRIPDRLRPTDPEAHG